MTHNHNLEINPNTAMDNNPVHEAMLFYWGARCPDHEDGCPVCVAWQQYDIMYLALRLVSVDVAIEMEKAKLKKETDE